MGKERNNNKVIIILLVIIIVVLSILVVLLATGNNLFKSISSANDTTSPNTLENNQTTMINSSEAEIILKNLYNDAVRHIFNQGVSYCGEYADGNDGSLELNGFFYTKSATFKSFEELDNYVKKYMTDSLLESSRYNHSTTIGEKTINSYYEKDGSLYCNGWGKGGNLGLEYYLADESIFTISNIKEKSYDGEIKAVYYDTGQENKTTLTIKVTVVKQNDIWLLNTYEEQ